ncbi:MAG: hypothetical protein M3Y72_16170 [Acidobacteriota bacterium]|nr:hypothetical protein [Acidobacteriota bacterium]
MMIRTSTVLCQARAFNALAALATGDVRRHVEHVTAMTSLLFFAQTAAGFG